MEVTNKSCTGYGEVKRPYILNSLGWFEPCFTERETASSWTSKRDETLFQEDDGEEQEEVDMCQWHQLNQTNLLP